MLQGWLIVPLLVFTFLFLWGAWCMKMRAQTAHRSLRRLVFLASSVHVLVALSGSVMQYLLWREDPLTRMFLTAPLDPLVPVSSIARRLFFLDQTHGFFSFYVWGRFWWPAFLSLVVALVFAVAVWAWKTYGTKSVTSEEMWLLMLMGAVLGWPLLLLACVGVIFFSLLALCLHEAFPQSKAPSLFWPVVLSGFGSLWFGSHGLSLLGARVLIP